MNGAVLYVSYNGLLEPILDSQAIPYMRRLNAESGVKFILFTFEKKKDIVELGPQRIRQKKEQLRAVGIEWAWAIYHKKPHILAKLMDLACGCATVVFLLCTRKISGIHVRTAIAGIISVLPGKFARKKILFDMRASLSDEAIGVRLVKEGGFKHFLLKVVEKYLVLFSDAIIVLTNKHYNHLFGGLLSGKPKKVEIIPCCVDLDRFKIIARDNDADRIGDKKGLKFMYLGKIGPLYFIDEMIDCFNILREDFPDSRIMFATQEKPQNILGICFNKGLDAKYVDIRKPDFSEIPNLIADSDCGIFFINPKKKFASFPIKLGEFLSCGIPVLINSGIGDTQELVEKYRVGVVVKGFSRDFYKNASLQFRELIAGSEDLSDRCRMAAQRELSLEMGVDRYAKIYKLLGFCK